MDKNYCLIWIICVFRMLKIFLNRCLSSKRKNISTNSSKWIQNHTIQDIFWLHFESRENKTTIKTPDYWRIIQIKQNNFQSPLFTTLVIQNFSARGNTTQWLLFQNEMIKFLIFPIWVLGKIVLLLRKKAPVYLTFHELT